MARFGFSNNAQTTISTTGGINSTATTFAPTATTGFPDATVENFQIKVDSEIMTVTGFSTPNWTVTRGQEGTTAAAHAQGAAVYQPLTKASLFALAVQSLAGTIVGARRQLNFLNTGGISFSLTDDPTNNKLDVAAFVPGESGLTVPAFADFTWVNQGTATASDQANGGIFLLAAAASGDSLKCLVKAATPPFTVIAKFKPAILTVNFASFGLLLRESGTSKILNFPLGPTVGVNYYTAATTFSAGLVAAGALIPGVFWQKIQHDGTNLKFSVSGDGVNWIQVWTEAKAAHFTTDANQVGWFANSNNATYAAGATLVSWAGV